MAGFLYFFPDHPGPISREMAEAAGLGYAFDGPPHEGRGVQAGPGGRPGTVTADRSLPLERLGYYPDRQVWRRVPGMALWVGHDRDDPPGPEDLVRPGADRDGYAVPLADGRRWIVPLARTASDAEGGVMACCLPRRMELDEEGRLVPGEVVGRVAGLERIAARYVELLEAATAGPAGAQADDLWAIEVLGHNYRLGPVEVVMLGLLEWGGREALLVLGALVDLPGWTALQKKRASAGTSTSAGGAAGPPATGPPGPT